MREEKIEMKLEFDDAGDLAPAGLEEQPKLSTDGLEEQEEDRKSVV